VSTRFGNASGKALARSIKKVNPTIPTPTTIPIYFKGYLPTKANIKTIEKISAEVEKLAGKINIKVINTGNHSSHNEDLKVMAVSRFFG
jgi:hypothetical protein